MFSFVLAAAVGAASVTIPISATVHRSATVTTQSLTFSDVGVSNPGSLRVSCAQCTVGALAFSGIGSLRDRDGEEDVPYRYAFTPMDDNAWTLTGAITTQRMQGGSYSSIVTIVLEF